MANQKLILAIGGTGKHHGVKHYTFANTCRDGTSDTTGDINDVKGHVADLILNTTSYHENFDLDHGTLRGCGL